MRYALPNLPANNSKARRQASDFLAEILLSSGLRGTLGRRVGRHFDPPIISIRERPSFRVIPEGYAFCHIPLKRPEMKGLFHQLSGQAILPYIVPLLPSP
jgi:hypothetical protein